MKTSELRKIIKEEISKVSNEDVRPKQLYGRTMNSHEKLKNELEKLFRPGTIDKLNNNQILDIVKDINRITSLVNNLSK
jgi:hypothetical protein